MSALSVQPSYPIFTDTDGQPLEDGYIWIGQANLDPQGNPINVYWDAGLTILAGQPIRTLNGYPSNNGTPARLYVNSDYSIRVQNKNGSMVYSAPAATERFGNLINANQVIYDPAGTNAVSTTVQDKLREIISVKDFGAVGDGVTDDSDAFTATATYINSIGGGTIIIPPGTYIVGKQTFAGATGLGYAYATQSILSISNCTKPVIIEGNGATIKYKDGLRYGSFDPVTGNVYNPPGLPFTNADYRGQLAEGIIRFQNNENVTVRNLNLDGNDANYILGGQWGDTGRQLAGSGIYAYGNKILLIENTYIHNFGLDGVIIGYQGLTETSDEYPHTVINVRSEYNGRQGLSWVGGTSLTAIGCAFNYTGRGAVQSAPGAGVDIEAESSVCRNGVFINCEMTDNSGVAMVADSGDSADVAFIRCKFIGRYNYVLWPRKPRLSFSDCLIVGSYVNSFTSSTKPEDATKYVRCNFTDEAKYSAILYAIGSLNDLLSATSDHTNVTYENCQFTSTRSKLGRFDSSILRDCTFNLYAGTGFIPNQDWAAIVYAANLSNVRFNDFVTVNPPADAFYIGVTGGEITTGYNFVNSSGKLRWSSWSPGAGGIVGEWFRSSPKLRSFVWSANVYDAVQTYGTAAPVSGTWTRGSRVQNIEPALGQPKAWVCTVGGTPGTWVSEGNL